MTRDYLNYQAKGYQGGSRDVRTSVFGPIPAEAKLGSATNIANIRSSNSSINASGPKAAWKSSSGVSSSPTKAISPITTRYSKLSAPKSPAFTEALRKLKEQLAKRGTRGIFSLGKLFKIMDDDNSGELSQAEFVKAMNDQRAALNGEEMVALFNGFDKDRSGSISYDEFLIGVRGELNEKRSALIDRAFNKLDKNCSGDVTVDDLRGVYDPKNHPAVKQGKKNPEEILLEFLDTFDVGEKDGTVTREEFKEYYKNVSASIDDDAYFEAMIVKCWKLDKESQREYGKGVSLEIGAGKPSAPRPTLSNEVSVRGSQINPHAGSPGTMANIGQSGLTITPRTRKSLTFESAESPLSQKTPYASSPTAAGKSSPKDRGNADVFGNPDRPQMEPDDILRSVKRILTARGGKGIAGLQRQFRIMDDNGDKTLDAREFAKGMRDMGVAQAIGEQNIDVLFSHFDRDGSGTVSYDEVISTLRSELNPKRLELVDLAFDKIDKDGSGVIEIDDIRGVYNVSNNKDVMSGKITEDEALAQFLRVFDGPDSDGRITRDEFRKYYANVSANIDDDNYFSLMMWNAWNLGKKTYAKGVRMEF